VILPSEREIVGRWKVGPAGIEVDSNCVRIDRLVTECLIRISSSPTVGDWEVLFQDPQDGRYWEKLFLEGEMQGGGPPALKEISEADALRKYGVLRRSQ
jgi:hypothetical protein